MPAPFVLVEPEAVDGGVARLTDDALHHLRRVLRSSPGDDVDVSDGEGRVWGGTLGAGAEVTLTSEAIAVPEPAPRLHVLQALPKGRKLDDIVQMLVELGVASVTPVTSERSVVRLDPDARERAHRRWSAVARAAAAQARRAWAPRILPVTSLERVLESVAAGVVLHPAAPERLRDVTSRMSPTPADVTLAVGPEGGWSDDEIARCAAAGLAPARLGASVLRTEHAAFAACAAIQLGLGTE